MAEIPRFYAQVQQVTVPRMRDLGYEQNVSIYKALKAAGERIDNTFFEMVAEGKLGQPNQVENPAYKQAVESYERAKSNEAPKSEVEALRSKMEQTPATVFRWGY